jgi:fatty-acyl-CoA synthase
MSNSGGPFQSIGDIQRTESAPYGERVPASSTYELICQACETHAQRVAFAWQATGDLSRPTDEITYAQLVARINQAANLFRSEGATDQDAIAILAPNMPETHFALWGAQVAARACPINYLLRPELIAELLDEANVKLIVALGPSESLQVWETVQQVIKIRPTPVFQISADKSCDPGHKNFIDSISTFPETLDFDPKLHRDRTASYFHTGGTTGAPKLAVHTHGNEVHTSFFAPRFYNFDSNTRLINGFPLFHVAGTFVYGLAVLGVGGMQLLPTLNGMRDKAFGRNYWQFCERERITALACVPTVLSMLSGLGVNADISSVQVAYTGGSPLPNELADQFEQHSGIAVRNIMGMTESAGLISIEPFAAPRTPGSTGLRMPYSTIRVVALEDGQANLDSEVATNKTGVVTVRGPHISSGYTNTERNPGTFEDGWLVTGDLGHVNEDQQLFITGRSKDLIIRGAHNLDPALIEDAFLAHEAVAMCAAVGMPDEYAGELPAVFVTLKQGHSISADELLEQVAPTIYEPPAIPKLVEIVDDIPVTAVGKIFKPALRERLKLARR